MSRRIIRLPFLRFLFALALFLFIFTVWMSNWNNSNVSNAIDEKFIDVDLKQIIQGKIVEKQAWNDKIEIDIEEIDNYVKNEFDDDYVAEDGRLNVEINEEIDNDTKFVEIKEQLIGLHKIPKPKLSNEVLSIYNRLNLTNPGDGGVPFKLPSPLPLDIEEMQNKSYSIYNMNEFVASLIPLDRNLPDFRNDWCKNQTYHDNLPMASVITIFHNEPLSMIMRTVYSILIRTPPKLLKEILLIDDASTHGEL